MYANKKQIKLSNLLTGLENIQVIGDSECLITGIATLDKSQAGNISFLTNAQYRKYLADTKASAVILSEPDLKFCPVTAVISKNPHYTYACIAQKFMRHNETPTVGIDSSASIGESCEVNPSASIGAHSVLGKHVKIHANVQIGPGCVIGDHVEINADTIIDANATIYHSVIIGKRCHIASGAVIGSEGFGFANNKGVWHKVPQLGTVIIGDDVDIGASTTIDRGAIENTIISNGVKLDNLIQVGHNVQIGDHTIIAGCVAIAGSTIIGKNCLVGGGTCFAGHLSVCDNTSITGMTAVTKSINEPGIYSSGIVGAVPNLEFRKNNARFHRLDTLMQRIKILEATVKDLTERDQS